MDVNDVMSTYNLNMLWKDLNNNNNINVPLINNVEETVKENYMEMNYSGQSTSTELQDIYKSIEPDYGISLTYNQNGSLSIPQTTALPSNGLTAADENIVSLLDSQNSSSENSFLNILSQYNSIEGGTFKPDLSSILSTNPSTMYNTIDSLTADENQNSGSNIDTAV